MHILLYNTGKVLLGTLGNTESDVVIQIVKECAVHHPLSEDQDLLLSVLHSLFEAQNSSLCQLVVDQLDSKLNLRGINLNPADCLSVEYFMTQLKDFHVDLYSCSIGVDGCKALFRRGEVYNLQTLK